jgi:hypothetical protein
MVNSLEVTPSIPCPKCDAQMRIYASNIVSYLKEETQTCPICGENLDWWKVTLCGIEENFMGNQALSFVGARTAVFMLRLQPGHRTVYRFSEHGVPIGAKVLYVNYTPNGSGSNALFPLEWHGNVSTRRFRSDEVLLYPVPIADDVAPIETNVSVMVTWVPHGMADESWQSLFDAFEAFIAEQYASLVVPANVAVESSLLRLMTSYLDRFVGKKRTEDFLSNAATYGDQLNVLLPTFAKLNSLPCLQAHIVGSLNRLRSLRNDLAHEGATDAPLNRKEAAEILCGALFGFHYVRYLFSRLFPSAAETET